MQTADTPTVISLETWHREDRRQVWRVKTEIISPSSSGESEYCALAQGAAAGSDLQSLLAVWRVTVNVKLATCSKAARGIPSRRGWEQSPRAPRPIGETFSPSP